MTKLLQIQWNPNTAQLRQFGWICLVVLPLIGWWWGARQVLLLSLAGVGLLAAVAGQLCPVALKPVFVALSVIATPMGLVLGEVAMVLIYFGVFLPIGILFRLRRRDALQLKLDRDAGTYWQPKQQAPDAASYYRQF